MVTATFHHDEQQLLQRLKEGDRQAFSEVFLAWYPTMLDFAVRYVDRQQAEDVAEDVFLQLLQSGVAFQDQQHLKAYLYRSIKHSCLDVLKTTARAKRRESDYAEAQLGDTEAHYLANIMQVEAREILYRALSELPEQTSKIIRMSYLDGKTNQEVADALGISINTVKTLKQRGIQKLRHLLPPDHFTLLCAVLFYTS